MINHADIELEEIRRLIAAGAIRYAGNRKLKIYGLLACRSGKRMKRENRVFFKTEKEALTAGFRPCGHCMRGAYMKWRKASGFPDNGSL